MTPRRAVCASPLLTKLRTQEAAQAAVDQLRSDPFAPAGLDLWVCVPGPRGHWHVGVREPKRAARDGTRLGRELAELENADPAVRTAGERLDEELKGLRSGYRPWRSRLVSDLYADSRGDAP